MAATSKHNPRILVIGETCSDVWVTCRIRRLSPESPCPILEPASDSSNDGMAGNVASNLRSLGIKQVDTLFPPQTIIKTRYVDEQTGYIVMRVDENDQVERIDHDELKAKLEEEKWDAIVIVDYHKGFIHEDDISFIATSCKKRKIPTLLDTKKILHVFSRDITFVKINRREYDMQLKNYANPEKYCENLIVTLGSEGSWLAPDPEKKVKVEPIAVADVAGSGDSFSAGFVVEYLKRGNIVTALDYANRVARIAASRRGVVAVKAEEVV